MDLIIGGAYQGKLEYACRRFGLRREEIFFCGETPELDGTCRGIYGLERYLRACMAAGISPELTLREDAVVICQDIFCGVVPLDREERLWRELAGRTLTMLAARAETVTRIFCGLPQSLKGGGEPAR